MVYIVWFNTEWSIDCDWLDDWLNAWMNERMNDKWRQGWRYAWMTRVSIKGWTNDWTSEEMIAQYNGWRGYTECLKDWRTNMDFQIDWRQGNLGYTRCPQKHRFLEPQAAATLTTFHPTAVPEKSVFHRYPTSKNGRTEITYSGM